MPLNSNRLKGWSDNSFQPLQPSNRFEAVDSKGWLLPKGSKLLDETLWLDTAEKPIESKRLLASSVSWVLSGNFHLFPSV